MKLFARSTEEWQDDDAQAKAWAHATLDLWRAGEPMSIDLVNQALRVTGDLIGLDAPTQVIHKEAA